MSLYRIFLRALGTVNNLAAGILLETHSLRSAAKSILKGISSALAFLAFNAAMVR